MKIKLHPWASLFLGSQPPQLAKAMNFWTCCKELFKKSSLKVTTIAEQSTVLYTHMNYWIVNDHVLASPSMKTFQLNLDASMSGVV